MKLIGIIFCSCLLSFHYGTAEESTTFTDDATSIPDPPFTNLTSESDKLITQPIIDATKSDNDSATPLTDIISTPFETTSENFTNPEIDGITPSSTTSETSKSNNQTEAKSSFIDKFSDQIRAVLKHFEKPEPVGFPGQSVLFDPMPLPNTTINLGIASGDFYNITVHGLSNFTIEAVNTFLDQLEVYVMIRMKKVFIVGNCTIETFITKSKGPFNITLNNVTADGTVFLKVISNGKLFANRSVTDMSYQELIVGSNMNSLFQSILNGAGVTLLASLKPHILRDIDERLTVEVNKQLMTTPKIPSISNMSPVDLAVLEGRKYVRNIYEPYTIETIINHDSEFLRFKVGPVTVHGLSKFARVGNVTLMMTNGVVYIGVRLITGRLRGVCKWYIDFGKVGVTRTSESQFWIEHVQFEAKVSQSLNLRRKPVLEDLQLETGPIVVKMDGNGKLDYMVEIIVDRLPNMLRHMIIDALEEPIKKRVQKDVLDRMDVEKLVEDNLELIETLLT